MVSIGWLQAAMAAIPLSGEVERVGAEVATELRPETCETLMEGYYRDLLGLRPGEVDRQDLQAHGHAIVQGLFQTRAAVQERLADFFDQGQLTEGCVDAVRRADIASRYLGDHVYEALPELSASPWLTVDGVWAGPSGLQSGDVLVTRATQLSSAGIAHLADRDSVFSHNALVYVDEGGQRWVIEAYLEHGALVEPLEAFLASGVGRGVVLRHRDQALAARAAEAAWQRVAHGPAIPYDDRFDADDPSALFCSEVPRWAFGELIGQAPSLPFDQTTLPQRGGLIASMGVTTERTAAPADVLFDPRFRIVGEWRDLEALPTMRRHDAVIESLFSWVEEDGYTLRPSVTDRATAGIGRAVRQTPLLGRVLQDRLSKGLHTPFLVTALALDHAARAVDDALVERLGDGPVPPRAELLREIEQLRQEDRARFEDAPRKSAFHRVLRPGSQPDARPVAYREGPLASSSAR